MGTMKGRCVQILLALLVVASYPTEGLDSLWSFDLDDYKDHVCNRPCLDHTTPRLCHYDFVIENYYVMSKACYDCPFNQSDCLSYECVTAGGVSREIKTANRLLPGPAIEVCEGDTIEVKVTNMLDGSEVTTIHWHGILQRLSPHMDGVPMVTQCPILMGSSFTYKFPANDVGTYFWHGHTGSQRSDGLFGALIVRQRPKNETHDDLYDYDLSEHVMFVNDWTTVVSTDRLAELIHKRENTDMTILINGMGKLAVFQSETTKRNYTTPHASFIVSPGLRYRFRVINSGVINCPLEISIDNHSLTIIASDGSPIVPLVRRKFTIFPGERYDFVLKALKNVTLRNYWIRVKGLNSCRPKSVSQTAILKYLGAPDVLPHEPEDYDFEYVPRDKLLEQTPVLLELKSTIPARDIITGKPDKKFYLHVDMVTIPNLMSYNPPFYTKESSALFQSPQINGITSLLPPAPVLTQFSDLPKELFCNADTVTKNCETDWCNCVHVLNVDLGDLVELLILDDESYHPMHLHGHKFRVIGSGEMPGGSSIDLLKEWDYKGLLNRTTGNAPLKDTVTAPFGGYNILRFRADNPGFWVFHCHLEFHADTGMLLVFQVGTTAQIPRKPKNFPTCGNWEWAQEGDDEASTSPAA